MKDYQKYLLEMSRPFEVDDFDAEDVQIIAKELGFSSLDRFTINSVMQAVYKKLGRNAKSGYDEAIADELLNLEQLKKIKIRESEESEGKNGYIAFYKGKQKEVYANSSYEAQQKAAKLFNAKKTYDVTVKLATKDGEQVTHKPLD